MGKSPSDVDIDVPPSFEHLAMVRRVVTEALTNAGVLADEKLQDLRLAVSEGTTNAIEAHQRATIATPVQVRLSIGRSAVKIVIRDRGTGFDPDKLTPHPPVTDPERLHYERGLGVTLMKTLADRCDIKSGPKGTTITLTMFT